MLFHFRNNSFSIKLIFHQTRFTEKNQTRDYTFNDLVGDCGGYIGLFLGYALVHVPWLIEFLFNTIKRKLLSANVQNVNQISANNDVIN